MSAASDDHEAEAPDLPEVDADRQPTPAQRAKRAARGSGSVVLGAAMLAVGDILEPEKSSVEIVQTNDDPEPDFPPGIDFGSLPPLD